MMLEANLGIIKRAPTANLSGDLALKISRKLAYRKQANEEAVDVHPLTREEECCTYAQWMPNLNELAGSTRLKSLMEEDLLSRPRPNKKASLKADLNAQLRCAAAAGIKGYRKKKRLFQQEESLTYFDYSRKQFKD